MVRSVLRLLIALALCDAAAALAAKVYVTAIGRSEVQVIVNGSTVRNLRIGDVSPEGVKLAEIRGGTATFEIGGRAIALGIGQSTVAESQLRADAGGHFFVDARVNGAAVRGVIDTGASAVTLNMDLARRIGLDLTHARRVVSQTANGPVTAWQMPLRSVQIGDIAVSNVLGQVIEGGADRLPVVLIGMSFLQHVEMRRSGDTMSLSRPHLQ
jgi:aspartyl protease family protein